MNRLATSTLLACFATALYPCSHDSDLVMKRAGSGEYHIAPRKSRRRAPTAAATEAAPHADAPVFFQRTAGKGVFQSHRQQHAVP